MSALRACEASSVATKHRLALALGVLATLALVAWVLLSRSPAPDGGSATPDSGAAPVEPPVAIDASLSGPGGPTKVEPPSSTRLDPEVALLGPWARVFVEGDVRGAEGELDHALVIVRPGPLKDSNRGAAAALAAWTRPKADGHFRVELSHVFPRDATLHITELDLQLAIDGRMPQTLAVPVTFTRADLAKDGELILRADFETTPLCTVTGRVRAPRELELPVQVVAFSLRNGQPLENVALAQAEGPEGEFHLRLPCGQPHVLLLYAEGLRPLTLDLPSRAIDLGQLELDFGAHIRGTWNSSDPDRQATLTADLQRTPRGKPIVVGALEFAWIDGRFEWVRASSRPLAGGAFEFSGLIPGASYRLESGYEGNWRLEADVRAPVEGLALEPDFPLLLVRTEIIAPRDVTVVVRSPDGRERLTSARIGFGSVWHLRAPLQSTVTILSDDGRTLGETTISSAEATLVVDL